jgi:hypothetical protein
MRTPPSIRLPVAAMGLILATAGCGTTPPGGSASASASPPVASASVVATSPSPAAASGVAPSSSAATADQRIDVPGGPLGLDLADGHAWVVATDGGQLVDVDLATGATHPIEIGPSANWVKVLEDGRVVLSRYGPAPGRSTLEIIDITDGSVTPILEDPIEGLDVDERGIWAIAKGGTVIAADTSGGIAGQTPVDIAANEHTDIVGTGEAAFASSDSTPVRRVDREPAKVSATVTTDGGVPFVADGGLVWGARPDELWAIDPAAAAVTRRYPLTDVAEILDLDVDGEDAWIAVRHPGRIGAVIRLDLATGQEVADLPVSLPAAVVIEGDRTWVTDYEAGALLGFDR